MEKEKIIYDEEVELYKEILLSSKDEIENLTSKFTCIEDISLIEKIRLKKIKLHKE